MNTKKKIPNTDKVSDKLTTDYSKLMDGFNFNNKIINPTPQFHNPNDYFVKFSLYTEQESGKTSTGTCYII